MENFILTFGIPEEACDALVEYHKENVIQHIIKLL